MWIWALIRGFLTGQEAATAVEYAVLLALIIVAAIAGINTVGISSSGLWNSNEQQITTAMEN